MNTLHENTDLSSMSEEELQAKDLVKKGYIDQALEIYQSIKPESAQILITIGILYREKKGDYHTAIEYFEKALQIQEKNNEDISNILTDIGFAYQNLHQLDLSLEYHCRALSIRQTNPDTDPKLLANTLIGIACAYWAQKNLSEALNYAQQALALNEAVKAENDLSIVTNLATLANIYHDCGDDVHALELDKRALSLLEQCTSSDSTALVLLLNNIGTIQFGLGLFQDALLTFVRVDQIYKKSIPEGHPKRVTINNNIKRITNMQRNNDLNAYSYMQKFLTKILLF